MAFIHVTIPPRPPDIQIYALVCVADTEGQATQRVRLCQFVRRFYTVRPLEKSSALPEMTRSRIRSGMRIGGHAEPIEALKYLRTIVAKHRFIDIVGRRAVAGPANKGRRGARRIHESETQSNFHRVGTCRMGRAEDPRPWSARLRARG